MTKCCSKCGEEKDESEFFSNGRGGLRSDCKPCATAVSGNSRAAPTPTLAARKLQELLDANGIDVSEIGSVDKIKLYEQGFKNADGEGEVQTLASFELSPAWADGPKWQPVDRPEIKIPKRKKKSPKLGGDRTTLVLPDIQAGYWQDQDGKLWSTHDERAIDIVYQLMDWVQPGRVVMHGDNLDLPAFSDKFLSTPSFSGTTQATIDWVVEFLATLQDISPGVEIDWLEGNHEERLPRWMLRNAKEAYGLRKGRPDPEDWPVMSVPYLCRFDEFDVTYHSGYPANKVWVNDQLYVIHGNIARKNPGATAREYLQTAQHSVLYGHIHRREWAEVTRESMDGPRAILAASAGCLCKIDGAVPSVKGGVDQRTGGPIKRYEDWQQGLFVISHDAHHFQVESVPIFEGEGFFRGERFNGN